MKRLFPPLLALLLTLSCAAAEGPVCWVSQLPAHVTVTHTSGVNAWNEPSYVVEDEGFIAWLRALLTVDDPCPAPVVSSPDSLYEVAFSDGDTYVVWHDSLYEQACVTRPDGSVHALSADVPNMLYSGMYEGLSFDIPEEHRALLASYGWTVAFRHPHMLEKLPAALHTSRTDPTALYFAWADLFLRDGGYDITPCLGQAVVPYVYTLLEGVPRSAFTGREQDTYRCSLFAVVLTTVDGQVIGSYLKAYAWEGSWLLSLKGSGAPALLDGMTIRDYLLARLPLTEDEAALAALSPEEVIARYGAVRDPGLMEITELLDLLGTAASTLYNPLVLMAVPSGDTVTSVKKLDVTDGDAEAYQVYLGTRMYFPYLVHESPETGWKVVSFYNTGF